jgi:tetratricopeptide (TPR) repeat protein
MNTMPGSDTVFAQAIEIASFEDRVRFLEKACAHDPDLRREVEKLVRDHFRAGDFLEMPAGHMVGTPDAPQAEAPGMVIGPYKLLEQIGEGGFGVVFMAEQQEPIRRKVALKVLKPGMETHQVVARFEAERQALAIMDHANIAKVLDGGATVSGRPYFVMDLVKGLPITEYCDQGQLTARERLELFAAVCQAVQHAHQKGIIHRDIKPSNVLVTVQDGTPLVKVIDFGIAKALGQQLTDKSVFTGFAQMIGTPLYMSPEQAALSNVDVDTRSDIYSLGVLLYELLTGTTPFEKERFKDIGYEEIRRIIREEEPPRPSTRISTLGQAATTVSTQRKSNPKRLSQLFRGELDWIVMKALDKDRNRRYESASAFAADVQCYAHDEPVLACPPSAWYRFRKFTRRNKTGSAVAGLMLFFVLLLGSGVGWVVRDRGARRAETERAVTASLSDARTHLAEADEHANDPKRLQAIVRLAELAVERAEELLLTGEGTEELVGRVQQAREAIDAAKEDSQVSAQLDHLEVGLATVASKSRHDEAERRVLSQCAAILREYGVDPTAPDVAAARVRGSRVRTALLAALENWRRRTEDDTERQRLEQVLDLVEPEPDAFRVRWRTAARRRDRASLQRLASDVAVQRLPPTDLLHLAADLESLDQGPAAAQLLRQACDRYPAHFWLNFQLGRVLLHFQPPRAREAIPHYQAALALRGPEPLLHYNLGFALYLAGNFEGAIRQYQAALESNPNMAMAHNGWGLVLKYRNDVNGAMSHFDIAIQLDSHNAEAHNNRGLVLHQKRDYEGATREYQIALGIDPLSAPAHNNLGLALRQHKHDLEAAIREYEAAVGIDPNYDDAHYNLANALNAKNDLKGAIGHYQTAIHLNPSDADFHYKLGNTLTTKGDRDEAIEEYRAAIRLDPKRAKAHNNLGVLLRDKGDLKGAISAFQAATKIDTNYARAHFELGFTLAISGDMDGAITELATGLNIDPDRADAHNNLGKAYSWKGKVKEAIIQYKAAIRIIPRNADYHFNLANALMDTQDLPGAISEYQAVIEINHKHAGAHCNLGLVYLRQGRFGEAVHRLKTGHELGTRTKGWANPSAQWVRQAEVLADLDARLPQLLSGEQLPNNAASTVFVANFCQEHKKLYATAVRFYGDAFDRDPRLADHLDDGHRYNAACAAALAGCGQGKDAAELDDEERARLRRKALDWLRADCAYYSKLADSGPVEVRSVAEKWFKDCLADTDFAGVRADALAKLPEAERKPWQQLWADVENALRKANNKDNKGQKK